MSTKRANAARVAGNDPGWETLKADRRPIDHNAAVQESAALQRQFYALWGHVVAASPVDLNEVLRTLIMKKIPFVLTGAHGIGGWTGRPRATQDVDILVRSGRNHSRAVNALRTLYPQLEVRKFSGVTAFFIPGQKESVIDVTYPHRADLEATLANPAWTENKREGLRYRVPSLEAALANKYGAMMTPSRDMAKRQQDAVDFAWMVRHSTDDGQQSINLQELEALGEMVWPSGGGRDIVCLVQQVKAGRPIHVDETGRFIKTTR